MSEDHKQVLLDISSMAPFLKEKFAQYIKGLMESSIDDKLLLLAPDANLDDLDVTEKLMLLEELSLTDEERKKLDAEAIPFEQALKEAGLNMNDLHD